MGLSKKPLKKGEVVFQLMMNYWKEPIVCRGIDLSWVTSTYCFTSDIFYMERFIQMQWRVKTTKGETNK